MKSSFSKVFLVLRNYLRGIRIALKGKKIFVVNKNSYCEDDLATNHITDFLQDKVFIRNYQEAAKNTNMSKLSHRILYRAYIVNYFADFAIKKFEGNKGCFVELGTHKGLMAKLIILNTDLIYKNINFYLFDTFKGIPSDQLNDNLKKKFIDDLNTSLYKEDVFKFVQKKFEKYEFVRLIQGILPTTLNNKDLSLDYIKFLHIDLNNSYAEIESIKILYEKLLVGAPVILDDYCYSELYRDQKNSWDKFIRKKGTKILSLPTGQGLFFKI
jgi:O-methyltransferase